MTAESTPLERFLLGAARIATGSTLHPVAILQAVENAARASVSDGMVANVYVVEMNPADAGQFAPGLEPLRNAVDQMLEELRVANHLETLSHWDVDFAASARIPAGTVRIVTTFRNEPRHSMSEISTRNTEALTRQKGKFIVVEGVGRVRLSHTPFLIGRSPKCDLTLSDLSVSRTHARIEQTSTGQLLVRDLGSRNKLLVDGESVEQVTLLPGVRVTLGSTTFSLAEGP